MSETPWTVKAGDKCTRIGCDKKVVAACLPHQFGGCDEHMREHDSRCALIPPAAAPAAYDKLAANRGIHSPSDPAAPAPEPCQRCGRLGGHVVVFRFDRTSTAKWICPHCLDAQEKRIAELEAALRDARLIIAKLNGAAALGWVLSVDALIAARAAPPPLPGDREGK